jgi:hypothetical protein
MGTSACGQNERALVGLFRTFVRRPQCRTDRAGDKPKKACLAVLVVLSIAARTWADPPKGPWPPFLPARERFAPDVVAAVERVWLEPTLHRTVRGRPARVALDVYVAFVDAPDVTAAAARYRKLAPYVVEALGDDQYRADDRAGARGFYRVLLRVPERRVILSWGEHSGSLLGTISGTALTVLDLEPQGEAVDQTLTAQVQIDQGLAAALARVLVLVFGGLADRKLAEGFAVSAQVAEWAVERPAEFCEWLVREPLPSDRRERLLAVLPCRGEGVT